MRFGFTMPRWEEIDITLTRRSLGGKVECWAGSVICQLLVKVMSGFVGMGMGLSSTSCTLGNV